MGERRGTNNNPVDGISRAHHRVYAKEMSAENDEKNIQNEWENKSIIAPANRKFPSYFSSASCTAVCTHTSYRMLSSLARHPTQMMRFSRIFAAVSIQSRSVFIQFFSLVLFGLLVCVLWTNFFSRFTLCSLSPPGNILNDIFFRDEEKKECSTNNIEAVGCWNGRDRERNNDLIAKMGSCQAHICSREKRISTDFIHYSATIMKYNRK